MCKGFKNSHLPCKLQASQLMTMVTSGSSESPPFCVPAPSPSPGSPSPILPVWPPWPRGVQRGVDWGGGSGPRASCKGSVAGPLLTIDCDGLQLSVLLHFYPLLPILHDPVGDSTVYWAGRPESCGSLSGLCAALDRTDWALPSGSCRSSCLQPPPTAASPPSPGIVPEALTCVW